MSGKHAATHVLRQQSINIGTMWPASPAQVENLSAVPEGMGRSEWLWVRFLNGDLALLVFPQGDTYLEFSEGREADYVYLQAANRDQFTHITLNPDDLEWIGHEFDKNKGEKGPHDRMVAEDGPIRTAAYLIQDSSEANPEYRRGIVEFLVDTLPSSPDLDGGDIDAKKVWINLELDEHIREIGHLF